MQRAHCGVIPPSLAHLMLGMILRTSFSPSKIRVMLVPCLAFTGASVGVPTVYTTDTLLDKVDEHIGVLRLLNRLRVALMLLLALVQCQQVVVKGRGREQLVALNAESEASLATEVPEPSDKPT